MPKHLILNRRVSLLFSEGQKIGRDGSAIFDLGLDLENFPLKTSIFFHLDQKISSAWVKKAQIKGGSASYLLRVSSGWVR